MAHYIAQRLAASILVLLIVSAIAFAIAHLLPGDPILALVGPDSAGQLTDEQIAEIRHKHGLDRPIPLQYVSWLTNVVQGDWGRSIASRESVLGLIQQRSAASLQIIGLAMVFALLIGVPAAVVAALNRGGFLDLIASAMAGVGLSVPHFILGIILIIIVGVELQWLPTSGYTSITENPVDGLQHSLLPAFAIGFSAAAVVARQMRASILEVLNNDYVRTARAKGLSNTRVITRHVLQNAMLPVVTVVGLLFSRIFSNAIIIENLFAIPGIGRLSLNATVSRDYPVIMGVILISAVVVVLVNFITDLLYSVLDPRIRIDK